MREIKFRAWDKQAKKMTSPFRFGELLLEKDYDIYELVTKDDITIFYPGDGDYCSDIELMQYTGLKDKNGVEIYEGDIVEDNANRYKVIYHMDGFYLHSTYSPDDMLLQLRHSNGLNEVIGNIYENPELIGGKD